MNPFLDGRPKIAFYGDDFTGATDSLATATLGGLRSLLFLRVPDSAQLRAAGRLDCLGIAGTARSMAPGPMHDELAPVSAFFSGLRAPVTHYKICSTFDSAPEVGNIGAAIRLLRARIANPFIPIVGGQPNLRRYCVFSQLYAAGQEGGEVFRIDRHPTMSRHPVTPMTEADLRVHLLQQSLRVTGVHYPSYGNDERLAAEVDVALAGQPDALLFDVSREDELAGIGRLIWDRALRQPLLAVGASGVIQALLAAWRSRQWLVPQPPPVAPIAAAQGPVLVLAGSLSPTTARQVEAAHSYSKLVLDAGRLYAADMHYRHVMAREITQLLGQGISVLACTSAPHSGRVGEPDAAHRLARSGGELLREILQLQPLRRVGVAGGDTSSHALRACEVWGLSYRGQLAPGVALCRAHADAAHLEGLELMLKGGQMGGDDLFERLLHGSASGSAAA